LWQEEEEEVFTLRVCTENNGVIHFNA